MLTGVFEAITRDEISDLIKNKGGKCTGSVSGKTNYLIAGAKLEDGREACESNKYKNAVAKGVPILTETQFEEFVRKRAGFANFTLGKRNEILA